MQRQKTIGRVQRAVEVGADGYVLKPFERAELLSTAPADADLIPLRMPATACQCHCTYCRRASARVFIAVSAAQPMLSGANVAAETLKETIIKGKARRPSAVRAGLSMLSRSCYAECLAPPSSNDH